MSYKDNAGVKWTSPSPLQALLMKVFFFLWGVVFDVKSKAGFISGYRS